MADDPYVYPGTSVLRNHFGLRDPDALAQREADASALRLAQLRERPLPGRYDLAHLQEFHGRLFGDVYPWAGEIRTVAIAKTDMFALPAHVETYLGGVLAELPRENYLRGLDREQLVDRLTHYLGEINAAHPFREGNGRTQRAFLGQLARDAGHRIAWERVDAERNVNASIASMRGDDAPLRAMLNDVVEPTRDVAAARDLTATTEATPAPMPTPARLSAGRAALLGRSRTAALEDRAEQLAPSGTDRDTLGEEHAAGEAAFATLNGAAAAQAGRLEGAERAAAASAITAQHRLNDLDQQIAGARGRAARDVRAQREAVANTLQRAERDRDAARGQLRALREHGLHPDQWYEQHGEAAARGLAADHELAQRDQEHDVTLAEREPEHRLAADRELTEPSQSIAAPDAGYDIDM